MEKLLNGLSLAKIYNPFIIMKFNLKVLIFSFGLAFTQINLDEANSQVISYLLQTEKTYPSSYFPSYKSPYLAKEEVNPFPNVKLKGVDAFPLVWYDGGIKENSVAQNAALQRISDIASTGATGVLPYFGAIAKYSVGGTIPTNSFINRYFDEAKVHNLSVFLVINVTLVCDYVLDSTNRTKHLKDIMNFVDHYSQRDNLSGWYLFDEPSIGDHCTPSHPDNLPGKEGNPILIDPLITLYKAIKDTLAELGRSDQHIYVVDVARSSIGPDSIAPNRPKGWGDSENGINNAKYALATDYVMWDHYPSGDNIIGVPLSQDTTTKVISAYTNKPVIPVLVAENEFKRFFNNELDSLGKFLGECQKLGIFNKEVCFDKMYFEQRYAFYSSIVHGARGVFHYMYYFADQGIRDNIKELYSEFKHIEFQKMLLLPPPTETTLLVDYKFDQDINGINDLNYTLRKWNGKYYVIAVNDSKFETGLVYFRLLDKTVESVSVLEKQSIKNTLLVNHQNVFGDSFKAFETKIYEITTTP